MTHYFGVLPFLLFQILSFLFAYFIRKITGNYNPEPSKKIIALLERSSYVLLIVAFIYILMSYFLKISLAGLFTDFIVGTILFFYLDILYVSFLRNKSKFSVKYVTFRKWHIYYNVVRLVSFIFIAFIGGNLPVTYPIGNMVRTEDVPIFNKGLYLNYTSFLAMGSSIKSFKIYKRYFGIFEKRLFTLNGELMNINPRGYVTGNPNVYRVEEMTIIKKGNNYYYYLDSKYLYPKIDTQNLNSCIKLN